MPPVFRDASASSCQQGLQKPLDALLSPRKRRNPGLLRDRGSTSVKMVEPTGIEPVTSCLQSRGGHAGANEYGGLALIKVGL